MNPDTDLHVSIAPGADVTRPPFLWDWVDVTDRLVDQVISLKVGASDETSRAQASKVEIEFDNNDGALTPGNPLSPWYPHLGRGTPCRIHLGDEVYTSLCLDGATANRAVAPEFGPVDGVLRVEFDGLIDWSAFAPGTNGFTLAGQFKSPDDERGWLLWVSSSRRIVFSWSSDGVTPAGNWSAQRRLPWQGIARGAVAVELTPDNGSGEHELTFEIADTIDGPWETLHSFTFDGVTSVYAADAPLEVGAWTGDATAPFVGQAFRCRVYDGPTLVADAHFSGLDAGTTAWTDAAGVEWELVGDAAIVGVPTHIRHTGTIDEFALTWPWGDLSTDTDPGEARVTVTVAGPNRRLQQGDKPLHSSLRRRVTDERNLPSIVAYWPCEDDRDAERAASPLPGVAPMLMAGLEFATDDTLAASLPLPRVPEGKPAGWNGSVPVMDEGSWVVEWFCRIPELPSSGLFPIMVVGSSGTVRNWYVRVTAGGAVQLVAEDADGVRVVAGETGAGIRFTEYWLLWRLAVEQQGSSTHWSLGWFPMDRSGVGGGFEGTWSNTRAGRPTSLRNLFHEPPPGGFSIGHMIVQSGLPLGWLAQAETAFAGEPAGERYLRLCREEGIPARVIGDPADTELMGPQRADTLAELLEECVAADGGRAFELRDWIGLGYRTRRSLYNQTPAIVFDASTREVAGEVVSDIAGDFAPVLDDQALRNDVTARRRGGSTVRRMTTPPPAPLERYDTEVEVNVEVDDQLVQQAGHRLALGTWPGMRYPRLTTDLVVAPHLVDAWLRLEQGDRVRVVNLPPQHPASEVDLLVEGWSEQLGGPQWRPELTCSPGGPWLVGVLDTDEAPNLDLARLDTDGSALVDQVDETATEFDVEVLAGPRWVTSGASFPFDIDVGGEVMRVQAISGTSSPQTFTVTRAVNGVRKAHPAGTPVRVAHPFRLRF